MGRDHLLERTVPGAKSARDMLEHFDEYARGDGQLKRNAMKVLGIDVFEAAAMFWGAAKIRPPNCSTKGHSWSPSHRPIDASQRLHTAIYRAARAVDASRAWPDDRVDGDAR